MIEIGVRSGFSVSICCKCLMWGLVAFSKIQSLDLFWSWCVAVSPWDVILESSSTSPPPLDISSSTVCFYDQKQC